MKKIAYLLILLALTASACARPNQPNPPKSPTAQPGTPSASTELSASPQSASTAPAASGTASAEAAALKALLPAKPGYQWQYFGTAEYAHDMKLVDVKRSNGETAYNITGKVADMSGGASKNDFNIKVVYTISHNTLTMKSEGKMLMDSKVPELALIKTPLAKGTQWSQQATADGQPLSLDCAITDAKTVDGHMVYTVEYKAQNSYMETREITEGIGVTKFERKLSFDPQSGVIGYHISTGNTSATTTGYEQWLPRLGTEYTFFGLAEYGHKGKLLQKSDAENSALYEYRGYYADGKGTPEKFVVRYFVDKARGTVTEQVISNERGKAEVNSRLHNLVILKFPLKKDARWSHKAKLNGKEVTVQAVITQYDDIKGLVKVKYTAKNAAGYYGNTYIEERTFERGYGMTAFSNLLPGSIGISEADAKDPKKLDEALVQNMFGYAMNKSPVK
jgi:hypothetical protein